jgi:hypothetical protein
MRVTTALETEPEDSNASSAMTCYKYYSNCRYSCRQQAFPNIDIDLHNITSSDSSRSKASNKQVYCEPCCYDGYSGTGDMARHD